MVHVLAARSLTSIIERTSLIERNEVRYRGRNRLAD
jgi:hypothetical protein